MKARSTLFLLLLPAALAMPARVKAQLADTTSGRKVLKAAVIKGRHRARQTNNSILPFTPGLKVTTIDSITLEQYQAQSVATLLAQQVPVFVKSYGFNGLATLNFRGSSAAQSLVYWNNVPLQNAALGITDVSTLPVMFTDNVSVVYGGSAALMGSGNVGGAILLNSEDIIFVPRAHLSVSGSTGSFGQYMGGLSAAASGHCWYLSVKGMYQSAVNDFMFTDNYGKRSAMPDSRLKGTGVMANASHAVHGRTISASLWTQRYERQVPPALFEARSYKKQKDGSFRAQVSLQPNTRDKYMVSAVSSIIRDRIDYADDAILLHTKNTVYQYYQQVGVERYLLDRQHHFYLFSPLQVAWLHQPVGNILKQQNKIAIVAAYDVKLFDSKLNAAASARLEMFDSSSVTKGQHFLLPGVNAAYKLLPWLAIRANVQRTYRIPTLNELFYYPGGNPSLRPEQGWSEDAGYAVSFSYKKWTVTHDVSVFNRDINNWIIWLGGAVWTPHNIASVHTRGVETESKITYKADNWKLHLGLNTAYVLATTTRSYQYNDGSIGKQIPYSPRYNGQLNIGFTCKKLYVNYNHTYTGYRFTVTDESAFLKPYSTGNIQAMYNISLKKYPVQLTAQCNNIWNERYTVVFARPMPGINFLAGFKVSVL